MDLSFYPLTLEAIDQADAESLCLFVGEDERPLTGLAGLADWRLSGGLSRLLRRGLLQGSAGEALLTPGTRLGFKKVFLFGLGPIGQGQGKGQPQVPLQDEEALAARVSDCLRRMQAAGVENAAMQLPARLPLDLGIRTLIDEAQAPARALVFGPDPAALVRALSHAASRGSLDTNDGRRVIKVPGPPRPLPPVRLGPPTKAPPLEVPKASPLSFAPSNARGPGGATAPPQAAPLSTSPTAPVAAPLVGASAVAVAPAPAAATAPATAPLPAATVAPGEASVTAAPVVIASSATAPIAPAVAGPNSEPDIPVAPHVPDSVPPAAKAVATPAATSVAPPVPAAAVPWQPVAAPAPATAAAAAQAVVTAKPAPAAPAPTAAQPVAKPEPTTAAPADLPPKLSPGKSPLPIDHKAPRFVPPKPKVVENGKGKKKR